MQNIVYIIFSLMVTELYSNSCIVDIGNRDIVRNEFTFHETIQSEHFVIHFTTADVDSQLVFGVWYIRSTSIVKMGIAKGLSCSSKEHK